MGDNEEIDEVKPAVIKIRKVEDKNTKKKQKREVKIAWEETNIKEEKVDNIVQKKEGDIELTKEDDDAEKETKH
ncbi:hypothetical protein GDO81_015376 [Engystomops pustulosus]|uniref:Uncharacterized protein n=1 Tax=Engystomops pustulosus TaxID=76066 RepID=A0AAV7AIZ5_ENGPU|nr:hypothetical protein GDO81_015376 [Engystomops pustulosus]